MLLANVAVGLLRNALPLPVEIQHSVERNPSILQSPFFLDIPEKMSLIFAF